MLLPKDVTSLPHDPGGKLSDLHVEAVAMVFGAQFLKPADPSNQCYVWAFERAIVCTKNAREGWLSVRTESLPDGDKESAGKAAVALSGFALELDKFGDALRWLVRARKELGPAHEGTVGENLSYVLVHVEDQFEKTLKLNVLKAWRYDLPRRFACCHLHEYGICPGPGIGWLA
jgi:hypothetical protein